MFPLNRRMRFPCFAPHFNKHFWEVARLDPSTPRNLLYYTLVHRVDDIRLACKPEDGTKLNIELTRVRHRAPGRE